MSNTAKQTGVWFQEIATGLTALAMTVGVVTQLRRLKRSDKLKFENRHMIFWEWGILVVKRM